MESDGYLMLENLRRTLDVAYRDVLERDLEDEATLVTLGALDAINSALGDVLRIPSTEPGAFQASLVLLEQRLASVMASLARNPPRAESSVDSSNAPATGAEP